MGRWAALLWLISACGIKGVPRPALPTGGALDGGKVEPVTPSADPFDAGCCNAR